MWFKVKGKKLRSNLTACFILCSLGGWWCVSGFGEIVGTVAIEMQNNSYIHALDTGLFTLGAPHRGMKDLVCLCCSIFSLPFQSNYFHCSDWASHYIRLQLLLRYPCLQLWKPAWMPYLLNNYIVGSVLCITGQLDLSELALKAQKYWWDIMVEIIRTLWVSHNQ